MKTKILRSAFLGLLLGLIAVQTAEAGLLKRFIYGDIPGTAVTNLFGTNNFGVVVFPNSPTVEELIPADSIYGPFYAESVNVSPAMGDYYGSWTPGYVEPPQTGNYVFYLSGDDETQLWLTSDPADPKNPAKKQMIATVVNPLSPGTGYSSYRQWNKYATQQSAPIYLEKGKRYYIEVLHKEGSGGDHIELGWQTPDGKIQQPMSSFYFQPTQDMEELPLGGPFIGLVNPNPNPWDPATYDWYTVYDGNNVAVWVDLLNVDIANQAVTFTWYKNNQVISGADLSYHFFRATMADNGATFRVRVQVGSQTYTSGDMGLTVNPDTTVPTVTSAGMAANNPTELRVEFSEDVEEATAEALSSYQLPGGVIQSASLQGDNRTVVLKTELLQPTQTYTLTIGNVRDRSSSANTMLPSSHSFVVTDRQMLLRIYFSSGVTSLATLRTWATSNADYLNARAAEIQYPVSTTVGWPLSSLHGEVMNNYQAQLVGYFTPPETGNYKFGLASDDHSVLFLSTDDKPANKKEIASVNGSNSQYQINEYTTQISSAIYLEAGKRYYIEAIWRDGTGGDGVTVVVQKPSDPDLPGTATAANLIPVECQSAYKSFGNVAITNQPVSFATMEGNPSSFTVGHAGVDGTLPYFYQWYRAGVPIPGANNYSYDFRPRLDDSDLDYYLVVSNYFSAATSAVVKVTVSKDVEKPTAVTAGSLLKQVVRVRFSEPVNTNDAVVLANYSLQSATGAAIPIYSAAMDTNNPATVVYLQTGPMTEYGTNSLTVQNVRDIAETPNTMDPATVSFVSYNFENAIRVNNTQTWGAYAEGTNITLTAGGSDIWGSSDQMTYVYKTVTGNFDLKYRGVSLTLANAWSKMGLMARESTNANSRNKFAGSSPATGQNTWTAQEREANGGTSQSTGDAGSPILVGLQPGASARPAVTYPNTWCRLQRIGNSFYYYYSSNGTDWTYWTVIDTDYVTAGPMPATMVVGLAATSHDTAKLADAVMAEFGPMVQGPLGFSVNLTNQTVNENMPVTFSVVASGQQPYGYEWLKNGAPIYDPTTFLPYTNSTYTVAQAPYADNGAVITCRLFNPYGTSMLSAPATLTVIRDTTAPTFALPMMPRVLATNVFTLQFSEILAQASAETTGNYVITGPGGTLSVLSAVLSPDGTKVTLTTAAPTPGATYTLTVNGVTDIAATPNPVAAGSKVNFYYGGSTTGIFAQRADGYVVMEAENATRLVTGTTPVDDWELRNTAAGFSGLGYMLVPSPSATSDGTTGGSALGPPTVGNGPRMEYDINFTTTGRFIIWVRGWNEYTARPGNCDSIFIGFRPEGSTTVNPLIVQAPTATTVDNSQMSGWGAAGWDWRSDRGSGSDPFAFTNSTPGVHTFIIYSREDGTLIDKIVLEPGSRAAGNSAEPATASNNGGHGDGETWDWAMAPTQPTVSISSPANNQLFANGSSILVTADTTAGAPIEKVEFLRATYVMGYFVGATVVATDTTAPFEFTDPNVPEGIYQYTARVTDSIGYVVSSTAGVRVVVDSTKPVASEVGCLGGNIIGVLFKDTVGLDPASATNIANYTVNNGAVQVANATLEHDGETVLLTLASAISGNYTVLVQNVADLGFGPNVVNPTTLNGTVITSWMHQDVGVLSTNDPPVFTNPLLPGEAFAMSEKDFYVRAGGADIWGNADGMHFVYRQVTGDFDIQGRVELITRPNEWSKAVLMAREDLEGGSRNVAILVAPPGGTPLGQDLWNAQERVDKNGVSTSLATALRPLHPPYPNAWMRLVREAGTFSFFWSTNGTEWTQFHTNTPAVAYPDTLYVGFGATSHDNGGTPADLVKVLFRDVTLTTTTQPPAPPTLSVARVGQALEISWTSESSAFVLESTSTLSTNWQPTGIAPVASGNVYTCTVPIGTGPAFYRVVAP